MKSAAPKLDGEKGKVIALAALLLCALGAVYFSYSRNSDPGATPVSSSVQQLAQSPLGPEVDQLIQSVESKLREDAKFINLGSWQNPVVAAKAPTKAEAAPVNFKLKGVARNGAQSIAFVNDTVVGLGEQLDGHTLVDIQDDFVAFTDPRGRRMEIRQSLH